MRRDKTHISAWILLSVLVPMLLLSAFHIHAPVEQAVDCEQCVAHMHHAGHITQASASVDDCVLCRMMHVPAVMPQPMAIEQPRQAGIAVDQAVQQCRTTDIDRPNLRAPPTA